MWVGDMWSQKVGSAFCTLPVSPPFIDARINAGDSSAQPDGQKLSNS
jgi:hypothetical protein